MRSGVGGVLVVLFLCSSCADGSLASDGSDSTLLPPSGITGVGMPGGGAGGASVPVVPAAGGAPVTAGVPGSTMSGGAGTRAGAGVSGAGGMLASAGSGAPPMAGLGAPPAAGAAGAAMPTPPGSNDPVIPPVSGDCPSFSAGSITYGGLSGIAVEAGAKASSPSAPMIFYWHGTGSFAGEYAGHFSLVSGVTGEGGVIISFGGTTGGDLLSGTLIFGASDFELTDGLVACAVQNHNVDPRRIFATGCSAGGLFSAGMAAERSNYMAAAAPNSGGWTVPVGFQNDWTPALMTIHGAPGLDVVIIDFSSSSATADAGFKQRGGFVINCNHGGGHCGGGGLDPDIWEFFKAHPYGTKPSPWASALPAGFNSSCEIY